MFRFSIRDLFWLTLVVALALGWAISAWKHNPQVARLQWERDQAREEGNKWHQATLSLEDAIIKEGGAVVWQTEYGVERGLAQAKRAPRRLAYLKKPWEVPW